MRINIVDAGCGVGKTTAMINLMNNDITPQKYLFITPFLSEVDRIKKQCPNKHFVDPQQDGRVSKTQNIQQLFKDGENIVTTHALFKNITTDMMDEIKKQGYILIMDEVAETIEELEISTSDLKILSSKIKIDPNTHMAQWEDKGYNGKFNEYKKLIEMNNIFAYTSDNNNIVSLLWMFPYQVFESFKKVFILTYMFDGQIQKVYFDYFGSQYAKWYVKDFQLTPTPQIYDYSKTKSLINVCGDEKLNKIGDKKNSLSKSWFVNNCKSTKIDELKKDIYNFFRYHTLNTNGEQRLWTTFKEFKKYVKNKGYTKGFAPINLRATNQYMNKTAVAYVSNRYLKPTIKNFFMRNNVNISNDFENIFALSELIQFIYRSAIRQNKPIDVYIPSKRMRELFLEWLKKPND